MKSSVAYSLFVLATLSSVSRADFTFTCHNWMGAVELSQVGERTTLSAKGAIVGQLFSQIAQQGAEVPDSLSWGWQGDYCAIASMISCRVPLQGIPVLAYSSNGSPMSIRLENLNAYTGLDASFVRFNLEFTSTDGRYAGTSLRCLKTF